tara:strand:+ start:93 stop:674 length:582 start_codon:yes stop_codon:yes gene_type:complete
MKTLMNITVSAISLFFIMAFADISVNKQVKLNKTLKSKEVVIPKIIPEVTTIPPISDMELFLHSIGERESSNRYDVVNSYGYMGKYQFGKATLRGLGYRVTQEEFLNSPDLQEKAMLDLLQHNKNKLSKYIEKYDCSFLNGIYITESGILAAAHLAGPGNVKKFFKRGRDFHDGYGTSMTSYMIKFSGYKLFI